MFRRLAITLLLLLAGSSVDARGRFGGGIGHPPSIPEITGMTLNNTTFVGGASTGTLIGTTSIDMILGPFTGTLSIISTGTDHVGTSCNANNGTNFQISGSDLQVKANGLAAGTYTGVCIRATQVGADGSPFTQAFTITGSGAPPPVGFVTSFNIVNDTGGSVSTILSPVTALQFKKGDMPDWPIFYRHDTSAQCVYSHGGRRTWTDSSVKHLTVVVRCPGAAIGAGGTLVVDVYNGGTQPTTSARTTTELTNAAIVVSGVGALNLSGTWTATLSDGIAGAKKWLDGEAGAGWIVDAPFKQSGSAHGQLITRFYTLLTTDGSGNLGGIRFLPRVWQPYYDVNSPAKAPRVFSSLEMQHGVGPTTIAWSWPYVASTFTRATSTTLTAPSANYYWGSRDSAGGFGFAPVMFTTTGTLPTGLNAGQLYYAKQTNSTTTLSVWNNSSLASQVTTSAAGSGTHTVTPLMTCLHFGQIFGATADAKWQYIQGGGSIATDPPLRTTREVTYWHTTKTIPPFDLSFFGSISDNPSWAYDWSPITSALLGLSTATAGERSDLGLWNRYQATHYYFQTAANEKLARAMGYSGANVGYSVRQSTTMAPPNVSGTTYTGFGADISGSFTWLASNAAATSGFTGPPSTNAGMGYNLSDWSHLPQTAIWAYLYTGEPQFLDIMIEMADAAIYNDFADVNHRNPTQPSPGTKGITTGLPSQPRAGAWQTRDLIGAAALAPDTSPDGVDYKTYFGAGAQKSLAWLNTIIANTNSYSATNGFHCFRSINAGLTRLDSVWQRGYLIFAVQWGAAILESSDAATAMTSFATWLNHSASSFGNYNRAKFFENCTSDDAFHNPITADSQWAGSGNLTGFSWVAGTPGTVTISGGSTYGNTPTNGDMYMFTNGSMGHNGVAPGGLSLHTNYYLVNCSGTTCNLAASPGGSALAITNTGSESDALSVGSVVAGSATGIAAGSGAYESGNFGNCQWMAALGSSPGCSAVAADALSRLQANGFYDPSTYAKFLLQSSY